MEDIGMTTAMPLWVNVFIAIIAALGGWEAIKYLLSLGAHRRKDTAEAKKEEITAEQQQADLVKQQLEMSAQMLGQMKQQNAYLSEQLAAAQQDKAEDRKLKSEYRYRIAELERTTAGLQAAFGKEVTKKRDAEFHYCANENCQMRVPKMGEYSTDPAPVEVPSPARSVSEKQSQTNNNA